MERPRILMSNPSIPKVAYDILNKQCQLVTVKDPSRRAILEAVPGVDAIFWATKECLDAEILDTAGPQMKTVGTMSSGVNHIDVETLKKRGVKLGNTPQVLDDAVADIAVLLVLAASRRLHEGRLQMETGEWKFGLQSMLGQDLMGATVGIVGFGGIGQAILKRLKAFQVKQFLYCGHTEKPEGAALGATFVTFHELVQKSDFVIASCPLTEETRGMFNAHIFSQMKSTAIFVNISRGEVVDQEALIDVLKKNKIFAAGLDVMTPEPLPVGHELLKLSNVVLLPHLGSATHKTRNAMAELTAQNILRGLGGAEMFTPVC